MPQLPPLSRLAVVLRLLPLALCTISPQVHSAEWRGLLEIRGVSSNSERSWTDEGLGKLRYDRNADGLRLGQAILSANLDLTDSLTASIVATAGDDRRNVVDITEAWVAWNPVPTGPWKTRVKAGVFFPQTSIEIDYDSLGWTPTRTLSSSAINSWIGEEIRTKGLEANFSQKGRFTASPHDYGFTAAVFQGNDPTGSLLAWRGWTISDRISGLSEPLNLADLPAYRPNGPISVQSRTIHVFREIDSRVGYYLGGQYSHGRMFELTALHYNNRGDPLKITNGQYSWLTRFDHVSARLRPGSEWEVLVQALRGTTLMGPAAVDIAYRSWYLLASRPLGKGIATLRFDRFSVTDNDITPQDPNGENGRSLALAYSYPLSDSLSLLSELVTTRSKRAARFLIGEAKDQSERTISAALRSTRSSHSANVGGRPRIAIAPRCRI